MGTRIELKDGTIIDFNGSPLNSWQQCFRPHYTFKPDAPQKDDSVEWLMRTADGKYVLIGFAPKTAGEERVTRADWVTTDEARRWLQLHDKALPADLAK